MVTLQEIKDADEAYISAVNRADMQLHRDFAEGQGRAHVVSHCKLLGIGVGADAYPLEEMLLDYVISQLAVVYRSPATRWLLDETGERLPDDHPDLVAMVDAYERSQVDSIMREMDRQRCLYRQCILRLRPSDRRRALTVEVVSPLSVWRMPDLRAPTELDADRALAVALGDGTTELWERMQDGWRMRLVDDRGDEVDGQDETDPVDVLPMVIAYDGIASRPWLRPKASRTGYLLKLSAMLNGVFAGIRSDSNNEVVYEQGDAQIRDSVTMDKMPKKQGPGVRSLLPPGVKANLLAIAPQIGPALDAIERVGQLWLRAESLPTDSFRQSQTVTGLGLMQLAKPLQERQESLRQPAIDVERQLWRAYRATHNLFAREWRRDELPELELEVDLGPIDIPVEPGASMEVLNLQMLGRAISPITYLMRVHNVGRAEAIRIYEQNEKDRAAYPLTVTPRPGDVTPDDNRPPNPGASTVDAVRETMTNG